MKLRESNQYYEGYQAGKAYSSPNLCPYIKGSAYYTDWNRGYDACLYERRAADQNDSCNQQFESLATKEDEGWSGEGLPPVGCECEVFDGISWYPAVIVGRYDGFAFAWNYDHRITFTVNEEHTNSFRPIRTEAERRREAFIESLMTEWLFLGHDGEQAGALYDAIAAGKIPGVKLEAADE